MAETLPEPFGEDLYSATGGSARRGVTSLLQFSGTCNGEAFDTDRRSCQLDCAAVPEVSSVCAGSAWYFRNLLTMHVASA